MAVFNFWHVKVGTQTYGPYSDARMSEFVAEGRIQARSLITADLDQGMFEAARYREFARWSANDPAALDIPQHSARAVQPALEPGDAHAGQGSTLSKRLHAIGGAGEGGGKGKGAPAQILSQTQPAQTVASPQTAFRPALVHSAPIQPAPAQTSPAQTAPAQPAPAQTAPTQPASLRAVTPQAPGATPAPQAFFVMAEIRSGQAMGFLQALQGLGPCERLGDTVWLVRAQSGLGATPHTVRDHLAATLAPQDRLFVIGKTSRAGHNMGADLEARIEAFFRT